MSRAEGVFRKQWSNMECIFMGNKVVIMQHLRRQPLLALAISLLLALATIFFSSSNVSASTSPYTFNNYELGTVVGASCPGTTPANCTNTAAEPQIRASLSGNFFASSENGLGAGTEAWRSTDKGKHFTNLPSPDSGSQSNDTGFAPGGGDTDLAITPVKNAQGNYNVYVASLSLANVDVSTSTDNGNTWTLNPIGATISGDDREWIAADGASKVCISYHDVATFNLDVNCSTDAGTTFTQLGDAFDTGHAPFLIENNATGNLAIDPHNHYIYQTFSGIANASEEVCANQGTCGYHVVYMAVSTDGGKTFTDHVVYNNPDTTVSYGHQFSNVSIDTAGNVYSVFCDNHNIYYSYSTDHGNTWSAPVQVNQAPAKTAIFPWSVANSAGHIDIVWYGTKYYDGTNPPDNYPLTAAWYVYMAQSLNATSSSPTFVQGKATTVIHYGGVCESGVSCTGNRDLYDDFGVAVNPNTGKAVIVYSDDQYINNSNNPPSANCTAAASNSASCDHTSIAVQTSGSVI